MMNSIKLNNVTFQSIYDSNADKNQMNSLFGNDLSFKAENDVLIIKKFWKPNLYFINFMSDNGNQYYLSNFTIKHPSIPIEVRGVQYRIGDITNFGNNVVIQDNPNENSKYVSFTDQETNSLSLLFEIDKATRKIIRIKFDAYF